MAAHGPIAGADACLVSSQCPHRGAPVSIWRRMAPSPGPTPVSCLATPHGGQGASVWRRMAPSQGPTPRACLASARTGGAGLHMAAHGPIAGADACLMFSQCPRGPGASVWLFLATSQGPTPVSCLVSARTGGADQRMAAHGPIAGADVGLVFSQCPRWPGASVWLRMAPSQGPTPVAWLASAHTGGAGQCMAP
jgi:hypothetical protein